MSMLENVMLPLREHTRLDEQTMAILARMKLEVVRLGGLEDVMPAQSAGGLQHGQSGSGILSHVDDVAVNLNELIARVETSGAEADKLLVALDALATDNRDAVSAGLGAGRVSMRELQVALKTVNEHLGQILINLEGGTRNINEFARTIPGNPARLLRNSESAGTANGRWSMRMMMVRRLNSTLTIDWLDSPRLLLQRARAASLPQPSADTKYTVRGRIRNFERRGMDKGTADVSLEFELIGAAADAAELARAYQPSVTLPDDAMASCAAALGQAVQDIVAACATDLASHWAR